MNTLLIVRVDILATIVLLAILIYDNSFNKQFGTKSKFRKFAFAALMFDVFGLITEITVNSDIVSKNVNDVCHLVYYASALLFSLFYFEYILSYTSEEKLRKKIMVIAACLEVVCLVIMINSEIEYVQGSVTRYSWGIGAIIAYGIGLLMFVVTDVIMIAKWKKIPKHIVITLLPFSILSLILMFVQVFLPEFLFAESAGTILAIGVYLALESPIKATQEMDMLAKKMEAERTMFRDAINANALCIYITDVDEGIIINDVIDKNGVDRLAAVGMKAPASFDEYMQRISEGSRATVTGLNDVSVLTCASIRDMYDNGYRRDHMEIHYAELDLFLRLMPLLYIDPDTNHLMCYCVCEDISERRRKSRYMREQLRKTLEESLTDEITGLFNRHAYENTVKSILESENAGDYAVVTVDINGLKDVNDLYGHVAGDELISATATCLRKGFAQYGQIYRMGGDEFTAILFNMDEKKLRVAIDLMKKAVNDWKGEFVDTLSVSCGYVLSSELEGSDINELQKLADKRMYESKSEYYRKKGVDRRNQGHSFDTIYATHNRMMEIGITDESHSVYREFKVDSGAKSLPKDSESELRRFTAAGTYSEDGQEITLFIRDDASVEE